MSQMFFLLFFLFYLKREEKFENKRYKKRKKSHLLEFHSHQKWEQDLSTHSDLFFLCIQWGYQFRSLAFNVLNGKEKKPFPGTCALPKLLEFKYGIFIFLRKKRRRVNHKYYYNQKIYTQLPRRHPFPVKGALYRFAPRFIFNLLGLVKYI